MKMFRLTLTVGIVLTVLLSFGAMTAAAQGPTGTPQVAFLDNQSHTLAGNSSQLFRFDYAINDDGTRPLVTITMPNGTRSGMNFEIWTADQLNSQANTAEDAAADPVHNQPLGRGTAANINCDSGVIQGSGACQSPDLTWSGTFGTSGTYFVRVVNPNNTESNYQLNIRGSGVRLGPPTQTASTAPAPAAAPPLATTGSNPGTAVAFDTQQHTLAPGAETWYRFDYAVKDDGTRPLVTITLPKGTNSGMNFEVWSADRLNSLATTAEDAASDRVHNQPLGRGSAANIDCNSGVLKGSGECQTPDLSWTGSFGTSGTYFVRVVNTGNAEGNYQLSVTTQ